MSLGAGVNWRMRPSGDETNGGGFDPTLTTNMLTDGAATSATGTAPVFSSASYNFVAGDVGAAIYIASGTNWIPGWYPIASVASNVATLGAAIDPLLGNGILANGTAPKVAGCATTASPTGATWSIDYSWLATAPKSASDLTSTASTTATSASGGLRKPMVGNILRQSGGSGATTGYYAITAVASATSMTLDRASGTMTAGIFVIGGAHATPTNHTTGGSGLGTPALAAPTVAGNRIWIRGAGSANPSSVDFDLSAGYWTWIAGTTSGRIHVRGYNGRPRVDSQGLLFYNNPYWTFSNIFNVMTASGFSAYGLASDVTAHSFNCVFDVNGFDAVRVAGSTRACEFKNSGSTSAGTAYAVLPAASGALVYGNSFANLRGGAISDNGTGGVFIVSNSIRGMKGTSVAGIELSAASIPSRVVSNTVDAGAGDGLKVTSQGAIALSAVMGNNFTNHAGSGKAGINCTAGSTAVNDAATTGGWDYNNCFGNNIARINISAGPNDPDVDPQYVDASTGDFRIGTNLKDLGFPHLFPG